jgi:hypothetical protein
MDREKGRLLQIGSGKDYYNSEERDYHRYEDSGSQKSYKEL